MYHRPQSTLRQSDFSHVKNRPDWNKQTRLNRTATLTAILMDAFLNDSLENTQLDFFFCTTLQHAYYLSRCIQGSRPSLISTSIETGSDRRQRAIEDSERQRNVSDKREQVVEDSVQLQVTSDWEQQVIGGNKRLEAARDVKIQKM